MKRFRTSPAFENSSVTLLARVLNAEGEPITPEEVTSVDCQVFELGVDQAPIATMDLTVSEVILPELALDERWSADPTGYNLRFVTAPEHMPEGAKIYAFELKLSVANGSPIFAVFEVPTLWLYRE